MLTGTHCARQATHYSHLALPHLYLVLNTLLPQGNPNMLSDPVTHAAVRLGMCGLLALLGQSRHARRHLWWQVYPLHGHVYKRTSFNATEVVQQQEMLPSTAESWTERNE